MMHSEGEKLIQSLLIHVRKLGRYVKLSKERKIKKWRKD